MALTIGEAQDVNVLLDWVLGIRPDTAQTDEELQAAAKAAAEHLADKAFKALSAGIDGRRVDAGWAKVQVCPWQEGDPTWPTPS